MPFYRSLARSITLATLCCGSWAASLQDNPASFDPQASLHTGFELNALSEPIPLSKLQDDDWGQHLRLPGEKEYGLLDARAVLAAEEQGWHLSALVRRQGFGHASRDTVLLARQVEQRQGLLVGQRYVLDYAMDYWTSQGFRLGKTFKLQAGDSGQLQLGLAGQYFKSIEIKTERFAGVAEVNATQQLQFSGLRERAGSLIDTRDPSRFNPFVRPGTPSGHGYALEVGLSWQGSNGVAFELAGFDLAARLNGKDMPRSYMAGGFLYDSEGQLIGNADGSPAIQGQDSRGDLTLRPKASWLADLRWQREALMAGLNWQRVDSLNLPRLHGQYALQPGYWLGVAYTPRSRLLELSGGTPWITIALASSHSDIDKATALAASLRFTVPFQE